jgi:archaellum biogenesis ATPase FlaH
MASKDKKKEFIVTGVPEVDEKLGGGIPPGTLTNGQISVA